MTIELLVIQPGNLKMTATKDLLYQELETLGEDQLQQVVKFIAFLKLRPSVTPRVSRDVQAQLQQGAICRAERDLNFAADWFDLEEEVWSDR